jgi:hypothetical protein
MHSASSILKLSGTNFSFEDYAGFVFNHSRRIIHPVALLSQAFCPAVTPLSAQATGLPGNPH